jgi:hypothetical protein
LKSSFDFKYDFSEEMNGYVLENANLDKDNQKVKLYIPSVMNGIKKGDPTLSILKTNGKGVFCNSGRLPTLTSSTLKEKNYLESSLNVSSNISDLDVTVRSLTGNMKYINYNIKKGSIVRTQFLNSKVSKLSFKTTKETKTNITVHEKEK